MTAIVLAEQLGPKAARRVRLVSVVALVGLGAVVYAGIRRLADNGQLEARLWRPLTEPAVIRFLLGGLVNTVRAAAVAMVASLVWGLVITLARLSPARTARLAAASYVEFFRSVPLVLLVLFCAVGLPVLGLRLSGFWYLVLALTIYNSAVLAEIFRSGVLSVDQGQSEAAAAIGLRHWETLRLVVGPQALRRMVPAIVSQLITLLKDTSLGAVIPYEELLRRGRITGEFSYNLLQSLVAVAVIYIVVNIALGRLVVWIEQRQGATPHS